MGFGTGGRDRTCRASTRCPSMARVLLFALAICAVSTLLVSLMPLLRARRIPIASCCASRGAGQRRAPTRQRTRSALVVAQVALALVLVAAPACSHAVSRDSGTCSRDSTPRTFRSRAWRSPDREFPTNASRVQFYGTRCSTRCARFPACATRRSATGCPSRDDHNDVVVTVEDHPLPPQRAAAGALDVARRSGLFRDDAHSAAVRTHVQSPYRGAARL